MSLNRLSGKVAIITGAGAGIGRATAELFAEEGATVVIAERDQPSGQAVADLIVKNGGKAVFIKTDVADEASVKAMAGTVAKQLNHVHILINNAAVFVLKGIDATPEEWRTILDVNVMGLRLCPSMSCR